MPLDLLVGAGQALPFRPALLVSVGGPVPGAVEYDLLLAGAEEGQTPAPELGDAAYIVYTSGTTGTPKGAVLSHSAMLHSARTIAGDAGLRPTDRVLITMPLFHVGAKIEWLSVQYMGGFCVLLPKFDPWKSYAPSRQSARLQPIWRLSWSRRWLSTRLGRSTISLRSAASITGLPLYQCPICGAQSPPSTCLPPVLRYDGARGVLDLAALSAGSGCV